MHDPRIHAPDDGGDTLEQRTHLHAHQVLEYVREHSGLPDHVRAVLLARVLDELLHAMDERSGSDALTPTLTAYSQGIGEELTIT